MAAKKKQPGDDPLAANGPGDRYVEFGATGLRQFSGYVREEWLKELEGWRGVRVLREMRDNDAIIGAFFFAIEMLLRGVSFHFEGATAEPEDQQAADFLTSAIGDMEHSWSDTLAEILTFLPFGWDVHEIVYKQRQGATDDSKTRSRYDDGMIGWRKFAGRAQETLLRWEFDESGDAIAMIQLLPTGGPLLRVPLAKSLHFRTTVSKNNPEGRSLMRNAYRSWFMKKRIEDIEAIGIERDLTGLPVMWAPPEIMKTSADATSKALYENLKSVVRDTSRNEQEGFILPLSYRLVEGATTPVKMFEFQLLSTGGRRAFDTTQVLNRYDQRIAATVLADFITLGSEGRSGSYAMSRNKTDMFSVAVIGFLDMVTAEFNRRAVPDLLAMNGLEGKAVMKHGDIARRDLTELGTYVQNLAAAGALVPDPVLEDHLREEAGLPASQQQKLRDVADGGDDSNVDVSGDETVPGRNNGQGRGQTDSAGGPAWDQGGIVR